MQFLDCTLNLSLQTVNIPAIWDKCLHHCTVTRIGRFKSFHVSYRWYSLIMWLLSTLSVINQAKSSSTDRLYIYKILHHPIFTVKSNNMSESVFQPTVTLNIYHIVSTILHKRTSRQLILANDVERITAPFGCYDSSKLTLSNGGGSH